MTEGKGKVDDINDDERLTLAVEGNSPVDEVSGDMVSNSELPDVVGNGKDQDDISGRVIILVESEVRLALDVASDVLLEGEDSDEDAPDGTSPDEVHDPLGHVQEPGQVELSGAGHPVEGGAVRPVVSVDILALSGDKDVASVLLVSTGENEIAPVEGELDDAKGPDERSDPVQVGETSLRTYSAHHRLFSRLGTCSYLGLSETGAEADDGPAVPLAADMLPGLVTLSKN